MPDLVDCQPWLRVSYHVKSLKLKRLKKLKRKKGFFQNPDVELFCKKWAAEFVPLLRVG